MDDLDPFERPLTRVQWLLGNKCNYHCSYCIDIFKRGDRPIISNELLSDVCKEIFYHYDELGRNVLFEFMGGEPTLISSIPEIGKRLHNYPTNIVLRTNGSADLNWWRQSRQFLTTVVISVHKEFADLAHINNVVEYLKSDNDYHPIELQVLFPVTHTEESWEWGMSNLKKFRKRYQVGDLQVLYSNYGRGSNMYLPYKKYQWEQYNKLYNIIPEPAESQIIKYESFLGYKCYSGIDTLTIDTYGNISRNWCNQEGFIGNIYNMPVSWPTEPIVCKKNYCNNGFDRDFSRKEKP